jgi:hypothetical protein
MEFYTIEIKNMNEGWKSGALGLYTTFDYACDALDIEIDDYARDVVEGIVEKPNRERVKKDLERYGDHTLYYEFEPLNYHFIVYKMKVVK